MFLVGFAGGKGVGKDTAGQALENSGWHHDSFAAPLRRFVADILGISVAALERVKEQPIDWLSIPVDPLDPQCLYITPRHMMQTIGTEWGRQMVHQHLWTRSLFKRIENKSHVFLTDVRFINEAEAIHSHGGIVIEIRRSGMLRTDKHVSEQSLPQVCVDRLIYNDGTVEALHDAVFGIVRDYVEKGL